MTEFLIQNVWRVDPPDFYLHRGTTPSTRPLFQGDVFEAVPLPVLPTELPDTGEVATAYVRRDAMLLPHPCQCHKGDKPRDHLVVAPVEIVPKGQSFRADHSGHFGFFPLEDLKNDGVFYRADLGLIQAVPSSYLSANHRIACLSELGVGLLMRRILRFQTRVDHPLGSIVAGFKKEWNDALVWEVWRQTRGTAEGYEKWKKTEQAIQGIASPSAPDDLLVGRPAQLIEHLRATAPVTEVTEAGEQKA